MNYLYAIPWFIWIAWFFFWEAWGFRKANDKWPTFSQLWKWWEDKHSTVKVVDLKSGETTPATFTTGMIERGVMTWTPFRWFTAIGLPIAAIILELHWVWEVF